MLAWRVKISPLLWRHASARHRELRSLSTALRPDVLLSTENQERCIHCMQHSPPMGIRLTKHHSENASAAVLILLCRTAGADADNDDVSILYTRRSSQLSRHTRQISFPGGIRDPSDVDFIDCALRETEEEIGLPRTRVRVWGTGALMKPPHTAAIMPVIGVIDNFHLNELHINEHEVEEAFTIPLAQMVHDNALRHTQFKSGFTSPTFVIGTHKVWGVTGYITNRFLNCLIPKEVPKLKRHVRFVKPFKHHSSS